MVGPELKVKYTVGLLAEVSSYRGLLAGVSWQESLSRVLLAGVF